MTIDNIKQAIINCSNGEVNFNNGIIRSFLYNNTWYPLRAIVNRAATIANEDNDLTTDEAMKRLVYIFPYVKIRDINYYDNNLINLNTYEKLIEIKMLSEMITQLSK